MKRLALFALAVLVLAASFAPAPAAAKPPPPHFRAFTLRHGTPERDALGHVKKGADGTPVWAPQKPLALADPFAGVQEPAAPIYSAFGTVSCATWFWEPGLGSGPPYYGKIQSQAECAPGGTDFTPWLWAPYGGYTGPRYPIPLLTERSSFTLGSPAGSLAQQSSLYSASNSSELLSTWTTSALASGSYYGHTMTAMTVPTGDIWDPSQQLTFSDPSADGLTCTLSPDLTIANCGMGLQVPLVIPAFGTPVATATAQATATVAPPPTPTPSPVQFDCGDFRVGLTPGVHQALATYTLTVTNDVVGSPDTPDIVDVSYVTSARTTSPDGTVTTNFKAGFSASTFLNVWAGSDIIINGPGTYLVTTQGDADLIDLATGIHSLCHFGPRSATITVA